MHESRRRSKMLRFSKLQTRTIKTGGIFCNVIKNTRKSNRFFCKSSTVSSVNTRSLEYKMSKSPSKYASGSKGTYMRCGSEEDCSWANPYQEYGRCAGSEQFCFTSPKDFLFNQVGLQFFHLLAMHCNNIGYTLYFKIKKA